MQLKLGPRQVEFLKLEWTERIEFYKEFYADQLGDGGPANLKTIRLNQSMCKGQIKEFQKLLDQIKKKESNK
jgi:hypothetical protein